MHAYLIAMAVRLCDPATAGTSVMLLDSDLGASGVQVASGIKALNHHLEREVIHYKVSLRSQAAKMHLFLHNARRCGDAVVVLVSLVTSAGTTVDGDVFRYDLG